MANLVKELKIKAIDRQRTLEQLSAVTEATRLIAEKGAEDMNILREMGMHSSVMRDVNLHGRKLELEQFDKKYGEVYTIEDIKSVACKYALKLLRSDCYNGEIDPVMLQKIKQFFVDSGIEMNKAKLGFNMFVLAAPGSFALTDRPIPPKDPILFYKLDQDHYRMIHKWGADLTMWRYIRGIKNSCRAGYLTYWFVKFSLMITTIPFLLYWFALCHVNKVWMALPIISTIVCIIISLVRTTDDDYGGRFAPWKDEWTTTIKEKP